MERFQDLPFDTSPADENGYTLFRELIWHGSETCNSCFSQVRTIGPEHKRMLEAPKEKKLADGDLPPRITVHEWFERTENGSQEYTTWDSNRRFGTCFCLRCGTDCNGSHRNKSLEELKPLAARILYYVRHQTPHELDDRQFGREIRELKSQPAAQGYETEILAIAFGRALERNLTDATPSAAPAAGD